MQEFLGTSIIKQCLWVNISFRDFCSICDSCVQPVAHKIKYINNAQNLYFLQIASHFKMELLVRIRCKMVQPD